MKDWGLAAAGRVGLSFVARIPGLQARLGPVSSTSYRLAARIASSLRAGVAVRDPSGLQAAQLVLLCVPGGHVSTFLNPGFLNGVDWRRKVVLSLQAVDDPAFRAALLERGASFGSVVQLPDLANRYLVEGDRLALKHARLLVRSLRSTAIEVPAERLLLFQAALSLSGSLFTPLLETTAECLRRAGLEQPAAAKLVTALFEETIRGFRRAGRKSWSGPIAQLDENAIREQNQALHAVEPLMALYFEDAARFSFLLYQTFPELTRYNKSRWAQFRKRYRALP